MKWKDHKKLCESRRKMFKTFVFIIFLINFRSIFPSKWKFQAINFHESLGIIIEKLLTDFYLSKSFVSIICDRSHESLEITDKILIKLNSLTTVHYITLFGRPNENFRGKRNYNIVILSNFKSFSNIPRKWTTSSWIFGDFSHFS